MSYNQEDIQAQAALEGMFNTESQWILTSVDVWEKNPHYQGEDQPHPESYEDEYDLKHEIELTRQEIPYWEAIAAGEPNSIEWDKTPTATEQREAAEVLRKCKEFIAKHTA